jgi:glycosyltransferase involved in cell wall biosynthesis
MLGKRDFHSGGYSFNFRMAEHLRSEGCEVEIVHFNTVPAGLTRKWFKASWHVRRIVKKSHPDLVIVSKSYQYVPLLRIMSVFTDTPIVYLMHHLEWEDTGNKLKASLYRYYVRWLLGMADRVWVNSANTRDAIDRIGIHRNRICLINPGFDKDPQPLPDRSERKGPVRVLCVGSISPRKAQHVLVEACSRLEKGSFELEFAGSLESDKDYALSVQDRVRELDLSDSIRFSGELPATDLIEAYLNSDILVHPSSWEAFGMSVIEGMWYGLPVISSDVAALPELVHHGENGFLVRTGDSGELAESMKTLITDCDLRLQMGKKSRMFAESRNDWNDTAREFMEMVMTSVKGFGK